VEKFLQLFYVPYLVMSILFGVEDLREVVVLKSVEGGLIFVLTEIIIDIVDILE
jgi:hypothetical protein